MEQENIPVPSPRRNRDRPVDNNNIYENLPANATPVEVVDQNVITDTDTKIQQFTKIHNKAYLMTDLAIKLDQENKVELAFKEYQKSLELIDKAIEISRSGRFENEQETNSVEEMVFKMRCTRKQILERVSDLQHPATATGAAAASTSSNTATAAELDLPPPYTPVAVSYPQLSELDEVMNADSTENATGTLPLNATELFCIPSNVQIYFIDPSTNSVSAPSYPTFLRIVQVSEVESGSRPPPFLQVGNEWTYPLLHGKSPFYKSPDGTYLFPDPTSSIAGANVGLILPLETTAELRVQFEELLLELTKEIEPVLPSPVKELTTAEKIAAGIITGAEGLSKGLVTSAEFTSKYLNKGTTYVVSKMDTNPEPVRVSPAVRKSLSTAKSITGHAVKISGYIVNKVGQATLALGHTLAPHLQKGATKLISSASKTQESEISSQMENVLEVTSGALVGFSTVYLGLEQSGKLLAKSLANNTVTIVGHRYGNDLGEATSDATATVGHTLQTGWNVKALGPKGIAKRVAKDTTGKAVLKTPTSKSKLEDPGNSKK